MFILGKRWHFWTSKKRIDDVKILHNVIDIEFQIYTKNIEKSKSKHDEPSKAQKLLLQIKNTSAQHDKYIYP